MAGVARVSQDGPADKRLPLIQCDTRCTENYKDPVAAGLSDIVFVFAGALKPKAHLEAGHDDKENVPTSTLSPIIGTTDKGNAWMAYGQELNIPEALWNRFNYGNAPVIMGYKIIGKFKSAFPNGISLNEGAKTKDGANAKNEEGKNRTLTGLTESQKDTSIIVFSDVDFIHDNFAFKQTMFGVAQTNKNSTLLLNALEALSGSADLMNVRAKGRYNRYFDVVREIELEADQRTKGKVDEINASIQKFQNEMAKMGQMTNEENIALIQNESVQKKKELAKKIALLKGELREVKRQGREKVEEMGKVFQYINTLLVPGLLMLFGFGLYIWKGRKLKLSVTGN